MKKILLALFSFPLCLLSVLTFSEPELKGSPNELRQFLYPNDKIVTIFSDAEKKAYSDEAIISLVITTENKMLSQSIAENGELRGSIVQTLSSSGIPKDSIKSSKFSTSPQYGWFGKKPDSYKVVNRMSVRINDEKHLKTIAALSDNSKEIELADTEFEHSKKEAFKSDVKKEALDKVMKQKVAYEKTLGVKLTPIGFRDSQVNPQATRGARVLEEVVVTAQSRVKSSRMMASEPMADMASQPSEPSFDEIVYNANITVQFKIE
ncbi:MAG: SIMPL domain-containing protein [Cellvibrionaceae bacterium]